MKAPDFWHKGGLIAVILSPIGWLSYGVSLFHRRFQRGRAKLEPLEAPVICVGNVTVGGAGKTPTARMLSTMLKIDGQEPHCISRGYGGEPPLESLRVKPLEHSAKQVGDEPLLLAQTGPAWVCRDRQKAAMAACKQGATVVIADDGLQNPTFHKDLSLLVMDSHYGIGNGHLMPAGPLREPLGKALSRCQAVILIGEGAYEPPTHLPLWRANLQCVTDLSPFKEKAIIAFAGLARPSKFFEMLKAQGLTLQEEIAYPDHHPYSEADIARLLQKAEKQGAVLMTTAKDAVKLPETLREKLVVVDVKLQLQQPKAFLSWLRESLRHD